jgi:hypothetical protein
MPPEFSPLLPFAAFQFRFACEHPDGLPPYPGSAWRGALGWSLKRAVCVVRNTECPDCLLYRSLSISMENLPGIRGNQR